MRGGKRKGAGRKKGSMAVRTQEILKAIGDEGVTPLEYMLGVLRDPEQPHSERFRAAIEAAPFMHPRLAAVQHSGDRENPVYSILTGVPAVTDADGDDQRPTAPRH